ncbi:WXG100 family type VII secretion target [Plantactinospora sp. KBS50]|uniref:WXG100 family type VII secretion target n=1 Tax=Plantactinospora sp. KBS50 TaxID=2024580 RepID=UPI0012FDAD0E|nr:hypothetical protein [Plantactinospora sp. KBS50]
MPVPANYNDHTMLIKVDPTTVWGYADTDMPAQAKVIGDALGRIHDTWEGLALGWAGTTAQEAQDFSSRWNAALTGLFGSREHPENGALPRIAKAVGMAALNYAETEDTVLQMFADFSAGLQGTGSSQPPVRDHNEGPITENTPSWTNP